MRGKTRAIRTGGRRMYELILKILLKYIILLCKSPDSPFLNGHRREAEDSFYQYFQYGHRHVVFALLNHAIKTLPLGK